MAITVINQPNQYHPAYHPVIWLVDSNIKTNDQFRYFFDIQDISGDTRRIYVDPRPGDGYGFIDISQHLRDYLDQDAFNIKQGSPLVQDAPYSNYQIQLGEEYKDGSGNIVEVLGAFYLNQVGFNSVFNRYEQIYYNQNTYLLASASKQLLINMELNTEVFKDDIFWVHFIANPGAYDMETIETLKNGTTVVNTTAFTADKTNLYKINLGAELTDPNNAVKFRVQVKQGGGLVSNFIEWDLIDNCSRYENFKLIYLDSKGSYNSLNFNYASRRTNTANPKTFKQFINALTQQDTSRGITRYFNEAEERYTVNTDYLTDKHYKMLVDLINAERVYYYALPLNLQGLDYYPVEILTRQLVEQKAENAELPQYSIEFRFSFDKISR